MPRIDEVTRLRRLAAEIRAERASLDRLHAEAALAAALFCTRPPSQLEIRGMGDICHDVYSGLERIFSLVADSLDGGLPPGDQWHRRLLRSMAVEIADVRPAVLSQEAVAGLDEYLRFRHLFRHMYGFELKFERVAALLTGIPNILALAEAGLDAFLAFLDGV